MKKISKRVVQLAIIWFLITFIIFPTFNLLKDVFYSNNTFTLSAVSKVFRSERALKSILNSFILAISLVMTVNLVGTLIVFFTEYWEIKGSKILRMGYLTSLIYGGVVLVTGYKFVYGSHGLVTNVITNLFPNIDVHWFQGYWAVLFIMTFACTSNHMLFLKNAIHSIDYHTIEAAKNMGASPLKIILKIVIPTLKPTFFALTILTFLTGLSAVSAPLIVGGVDFQTINPMIITFAKTTSSRDIAAFLAIVLGLATAILLIVLTKIEKKGNYISVSKTKTKLVKQKITNPVMNCLAHITSYVLFLIYMLPVILIILFSFSNSVAIKTGQFHFSELTLENYINLFTSSTNLHPYIVSIVYSILASLIVVLISIVIARLVLYGKGKLNQFLEYGTLMPWMLPSTLIAVSLLFTYNEPSLLLLNRVLVGTISIMLIAYVVVKLPFSYRMIKSVFIGLDKNMEEAAKTMGASTFYTMIKVIIPSIFPAILSIIVINFNSLLTDYDLSVFLYHPIFKPLGIVIKAASDEAATSNAQAISLVYTVTLMVISAIALYITQRKKANK